MFGLRITTEDNTKAVKAASDKAAFRNFGHAAATISKDAKASIENSPEPSAPGTPPHTRRRRHLPRAIRYAADKTGAVVGPMASVVGTAGQAHELGGTYKGEQFDERAFMYPALQRGAPRFAGEWTGSIGQ